jgi:hypothetical protein
MQISVASDHLEAHLARSNGWLPKTNLFLGGKLYALV